MQEQLGRPVDPRRGWDALQRVGYSTRVPRPQHAKADPAKQEEFKKTLPEELARIQHLYPDVFVELWAMDEHRIGLKPILRRVWAPKGTPVRAVVAQRYQWMSAYGFVHPQSGQTSWLLMPSVNVFEFSAALEVFAQEIGAGPEKPILLVLDGAGWHTSAHLRLPAGIHLLFLPPYSPEREPCERLWPLTNEPLANRGFPTLDALEQVQIERCRWMQTQTSLVRASPCFHWWPTPLDRTSTDLV